MVAAQPLWGVTKQRERSHLHLADPQSAAGGGGEVSCRGEGWGTERRRARWSPAGRGLVLLLVDWRLPDPAETSQPDLTHTIIDYWLRSESSLKKKQFKAQQ